MVTKRELQQYVVELIAECFGTFILILFNHGGIANYKFAQLTSHSTLTIYLAVDVGIYTVPISILLNIISRDTVCFNMYHCIYESIFYVLALMAAGSITGAHINPAVSVAFMTIRKLKPLQCVFYVLGQLLGAFLGAALVYLVYLSQFNNFDGGIRQITGVNGTGDIFFTMPGKDVPHWNALIDQIVSTSLLLIFIRSLAQDFNHLISEATKPFALILIVTGLNCAYSINAAAALNPARDLGPRLFAAFVYGWKDVFRANNYYFWVPIFGPILGGIIGVWLYHGYVSIITNYGQLSIIEHKNAAGISHLSINSRDDVSNLRQQVATIADLRHYD